MKKVLMIAIALFMVFPVTSVFASELSVLGGVQIHRGSGIDNHESWISNWTDGSLTTGSTLGANTTLTDSAWIKFSSAQNVTSYLIKSSIDVNLNLYDLNGVFIKSITNVDRTGVKVGIEGVQNVGYVQVHNKTDTAGTFYELMIYADEDYVPLIVEPITALTETHNYNSVNLSWVNPVSPYFTGTIIKQDGIEVAQVANTTSSYSVNGLDADTTYNFEVIAKYSNGVNSSGETVSVITDSIPDDLTPPSNITNVQVAKSNELASFLYTLPVDTDFSHLKIYRDGVLKEGFWTGTSYDDFALVSNTTYVYKFISVDLSGNESNGFVQSVTTDTTVDTIAPNAPTAVEVTNGGSSGSVKWEMSGQADVEGYNVYVDGVKHNTVLIMANSYTIPNLVNDQNYLITVTAVDTSDNESVPSTAQTITPSSQAMPIFEAKYDLKDVADGTSSWFGSMWLILAFSVGIPLAFMIARKVKGLLIA